MYVYVHSTSNRSVCLPARSNIHSGLLSPETQPSQPTDASSTVLLLSSSGQQRQCRPAFFFQQVAAVPGRQRAQRRTRQRHTHTFSVFIHATDALAGGLLLSSRGPSAFFFLFLFSLPFYIAVSEFVDIAKKSTSPHIYISCRVGCWSVPLLSPPLAPTFTVADAPRCAAFEQRTEGAFFFHESVSYSSPETSVFWWGVEFDQAVIVITCLLSIVCVRPTHIGITETSPAAAAGVVVYLLLCWFVFTSPTTTSTSTSLPIYIYYTD